MGLEEALRPLVANALQQLGGVDRSVKRRVTGALKGWYASVIGSVRSVRTPARTGKLGYSSEFSELAVRADGASRECYQRARVLGAYSPTARSGHGWALSGVTRD